MKQFLLDTSFFLLNLLLKYKYLILCSLFIVSQNNKLSKYSYSSKNIVSYCEILLTSTTYINFMLNVLKLLNLNNMYSTKNTVREENFNFIILLFFFAFLYTTVVIKNYEYQDQFPVNQNFQLSFLVFANQFKQLYDQTLLSSTKRYIAFLVRCNLLSSELCDHSI